MGTSDIPRRLYKYFAPDRVNVLSDGLLRYTPLGAFNDPFEGRPEVTAISTEAEALRTVERIFPEEAKLMYDALPPEARATIEFETLLPLIAAYAKEQQPGFLATLNALTGPAFAYINRKLDEHVGALCLSEVPDNLLMWSHYASSHTGFVLEFDALHSHFDERRSTEDELRNLRRVQYRDTRPSARLSELEGTELFFVKSSHWSYEREWRILRALSEASKSIATAPFPVCLFPFPFDALTSVILGCRVEPSTELAIRTAIRSTFGLEEVRLRQAIPDSTHFHLNIRDAAT